MEQKLRDAKIAVFYLTNNHDGAELWGARILSAHNEMLCELGRRRKPFVAHITTEGIVNLVRLYYKRKIKTINVTKRSKRQSASV